MFNVEPQEQWDAKEAVEFEVYVAARHRKMIKAAAWAGTALLVNILCIVPFAKGNFLHGYAEPVGRILVYCAMAFFLWFVLRVAFVWSSWQSARETRREFGDPQ
ncbi:hypothetical protein [Tunturiibacter lichenicola]|uniref:hypothetical protein n=1 Tax=Tunturiibacter lichenicola TaxID=2051959 RepID=UPI003D9B7B6F